MVEVEYLTDKRGQQKAVVIPIELWRQLFPKDDAQKTPLLNRKEALAYLEENFEF